MEVCIIVLVLGLFILYSGLESCFELQKKIEEKEKKKKKNLVWQLCEELNWKCRSLGLPSC